MSLLDTVKRANRPGPPEHSIQLRVACTLAVLVSVVACYSQHELSALVTVIVCVLLCAGMVFSYRTRRSPTGLVKLLLAMFALGAFTWFFYTATHHAQSGDIGSVEGPLAALFAWIQVGHSFDVPARRDLTFTLAGSATLMAVAAAQALTPAFGIYALLWLALGLWGLFCIWNSMSFGGRPRPATVAATIGTVAVVAFGALLVLPAPRASSTILFPSSASGDVSLGFGGALTGDSGSQTQPSQAGSTNGPTRVGGFLGFSNTLDTAIRASLSNQVIMRVRAAVPSFWTAETFDRWSGQAWSVTEPDNRIITGGSPFVLPDPEGDTLVGQQDIQTFYLATTGPNLIFHAGDAHQVWFPASGLVDSRDGTIRTSLGMGPGTVYTVESLVDRPTAADLEATSTSDQVLDQADAQRDTQLPHAYSRVEALAKSVTARQPTVYAKVQALISWIGAHTRYSTDIPPLPKGADAVNEFLFGNRVGYCEQISTALTVMLRTLGIPAREAVGYVPGPYDPITDLYDIQASDAHAWVQVWFPYYGWQSFDPTAVVPLANPSPAHVLLHDVAAILGRAPWVPVGIPLAVLFAAGYGIRAWRRRPQTWAEQVARRLGRLGARARSPRRPGETLTEFAARLDASCGDPSGTLRAVATVAEAAAYGRREPAPEVRAQLDATLRASPLARIKFRIPSWTRPGPAIRHSVRSTPDQPDGLEPSVLTPPTGQEPDRMSHRR
jgi:protein-glutamine gamma-glutamyltransferase